VRSRLAGAPAEHRRPGFPHRDRDPEQQFRVFDRARAGYYGERSRSNADARDPHHRRSLHQVPARQRRTGDVGHHFFDRRERGDLFRGTRSTAGNHQYDPLADAEVPGWRCRPGGNAADPVNVIHARMTVHKYDHFSPVYDMIERFRTACCTSRRSTSGMCAQQYLAAGHAPGRRSELGRLPLPRIPGAGPRLRSAYGGLCA
jgi:hypothetical protein